MSITPIQKPLSGESVVALSPENASEAASVWRARPNFFAGRALTAPTLERRQRWQAGRLALRGQGLTAGVIQGLEVGHEILPPDETGGSARVTLSIAAGHARAVSGEDVSVPGPATIDLLRLPVFAEPSVEVELPDADDDTDEPSSDAEVRARVVLSRDLGALFAAAPDAIPRVGILVLQPVEADRLGEFDPTDPCELSNCGAAGDNESFEDWRVADAGRLLWYAWPVEWRALPASGPTLRNQLAWTIFGAEAELGADAVLPWEELGVPLALIALDDALTPLFIDRASVVRAGGRARHPRLALQSGQTDASYRRTALWQAQIEQLAEQLAAAGDPAPPAAELAQQLEHLPAAGVLPTNAIDLSVLPVNQATESLTSAFFPSGFELDAAPVPLESLDLAIRESAALAPIDLRATERVRVLVPVPQAVYEPRLLIEETIDPEFQATLDLALLTRARALGARQSLRATISELVRLASGRAVPVPAIEADVEAVETESLAPWGPPPAGGGHRSAFALGLHQHSFSGATATLGLAAGDTLYAWTYLDPDNPPRSVTFQWHDAAGVEHRAYWAAVGDENLIDLGVDGTASRLRIGALPEAGRWVRLDVPVTEIGLAGTPLNDMAILLFDGQAAFGPIGRLRDAEVPWFSAALPAGATIPPDSEPWTFLTPNALSAPFEAQFGFEVDPAGGASPLGRSATLAGLLEDPLLAAVSFDPAGVFTGGVLSATERDQLVTRGLEGFIAMLKSRADRADDLIDYGFIKVQTDTYRMRQLILGTTAATRLAVSPALSTIAQSETAVASQERIASFFDELKAAPAAPPAGLAGSGSGARASAGTRAATNIAGVASVSTAATARATSALARSFSASAARTFSSPFIATAPQAEVRFDTGLRDIGIIKQPVDPFVLERDTRKSAVDLNLAAAAAVIPGLQRNFTPADVTNVDPLVGKAVIRTTSIAQRLEQPKALEAKDYSTSTRFDSAHALVRLADELRAEDQQVTPGLFAGVNVYGLRNDPFLHAEPDSTRRFEPLATFLSVAGRGRLQELLSVPVRDNDDEGAHFSDSADLADNTIALMRQVEGRVKLYRDAIRVCDRALATLRSDTAAAEQALAAWTDRLAEARHDVAVTRALIAEENERLAAINMRRASVLRDEVRFLAYIRPREVHNLAPTPLRTLDPGLLEAPVPACLGEHADVPDELTQLLTLVRESPVTWFVSAPKLVDRLDRTDLLVRTLQSAQLRSQVFTLKSAVATQVVAATPLRAAIGFVQARQQQAIAATRTLATTLNVAQLASLSWQGVRTQVAPVISLGDLIDGEHGRGQIARDAADLFEQISRIVACLHAEFSAVLPAIRLDWAERLSQFDQAPSLRDLSVLPRWPEIPYVDRRQLQAYADWLFDQLDAREPRAESLMNDIVRMALLLASDAPVGRILAGRLPRPAVVRPGVRIPLTVFDPSRLRLGMHALIYRGPDVVARAVVEDIGSEIAARVIHTQTAEVSLSIDARVQFAEATRVSLAAPLLARQAMKVT
jgi:hypothetical protein